MKRSLENPSSRLIRCLTGLERRITGRTPKRAARSMKALQKRFAHFYTLRRLEWLGRPRLHTAIFERVWENDELARLGGELVGERARKTRDEEKIEVASIAKELKWTPYRLTTFTEAVVSYRREPTLSNYLRVREDFPEAEIQVGMFAGIDPLFALEDEFRQQGIDPELVEACWQSDEPSIDALCLHLIKKLVERDQISNKESGHLQKRRSAISDPLVNYLIVTILESIDWCECEVRVPASFVVLVRNQLTGMAPDLDTMYRAKERKKNLAIVAAQVLEPHEKPSIGKLATTFGIPRSRAERLLKDPEFTQWFETAKKWVADGLFENLPK